MKRTSLEILIGRSLGQRTTPLSRSAIEQYQGERLRAVVEYCRAHSLFYQRKLAEAGVNTITGLADLPSLPLTSEAELRHHGSAMVCVGQDAVTRIITLRSSGTTGTPKRLFFTDADLEHTLEFFHQGMQSLVDPGQRVAIVLPGATPDSTGHLLATALERMGVSSVILGLVEDPELAARKLCEIKADVLVGFPVQILAVARMAAFLAIPLGTIRSVLLCSDYIPESLNSQLAQLLSCEVFTHYGTVESGLGGGVDCAAHCGVHLREADLLFEIIDSHSTQPLEVGEWGEIVMTTLARTGMPLIRYRTGDQGRLLPGPCPCGSPIRRLDRVLGRMNQVRTLESGNRLALHNLDELLFALPGLLDFRACLVRPNGRETLQLHLVTLPNQGEETCRRAAEILARYPPLKGVAITLTLEPTAVIHFGKRILADKREDSHS